MIHVKSLIDFLGIPKGSIGVITTRAGEVLPGNDPNAKAMWIKFPCKDMPVGICLPFGMFVAITNEVSLPSATTV